MSTFMAPGATLSTMTYGYCSEHHGDLSCLIAQTRSWAHCLTKETFGPVTALVLGKDTAPCCMYVWQTCGFMLHVCEVLIA